MPLYLHAKRPFPMGIQVYENLILPLTEADKQIGVKSESHMSLTWQQQHFTHYTQSASGNTPNNLLR